MKYKKFIPKWLDVLIIIGGTILVYLIVWIFSSNLKPNELGDAINPLINLITIYFLWLNWKQLKEEFMEERRMNKRNEDIKIGVVNLNIDKTDDFLIKPKGRGPKVDPFGFIDLTIKNFGFFPTYIESIDLLKINKKGEQEVFEDIGIFGNNIIFPGVEIQGRLYIQAPNQINTNDEGSELIYSFIFKEGVLRKKLELRFRYIGLKLQNGDIWYIPTFVNQVLFDF